MRVSCLNGETLECVRILHVGAGGEVVGPGAGSFSNESVAGLLDSWLNDDFVRSETVNADAPVTVKIPHPVSGGVALIDAEVFVPGESYLPFAHLNDDQEAIAQWPPRSGMPTTVSPELESARLSSDLKKKSLRLRLSWLTPFRELQPIIVSLDDMLARDRMRRIAEESREDNARAIALARTEAREWLSEGTASVLESWLRPIVSAEGDEGALVAIDSRYGTEAHSLEQAQKDNRLREFLAEQTPVTRAWGLPGLMWALLLERLSGAQPYTCCERCGRRIRGRGHKRFCSSDDNMECFRARRAENKRRGRAKG
jgi:hypothetical protein